MRLTLLAGITLASSIFTAATADMHGASAAQQHTAHHYFRTAHCPFVSERPIALFVIPDARFMLERLRERGVNVPGEAVWLDISLHDNSFAERTFLGYGPLTIKPDAAYLHGWPELLGGIRHYYRLNVRHAGGWTSIGGGWFDTPDCRGVLDITCGSDTASVTFAIPYAAPHRDGAPQVAFLDLSLFDNGFARGTFIGFGPEDPSFVPWAPRGHTRMVHDVLGARDHWYRVNVLYAGGGWAPVSSGSFSTPDCTNIPMVPLPPGY